MKIKCDDFNLAATLDCGQVFGFTPDGNGRYEGILLGHPVKISQKNGYLNVQNGLTDLSVDIVRHYFDLDFDLSPVYAHLQDVVGAGLVPAQMGDPKGRPYGVWFGRYRGLRIIRQDPWEALACFIISSNNNVKRIMGIYRNLLQHFRKFPSPVQIARCHESVLREAGLGYRAPFLWSTAVFLSNNSDYLKTIRDSEYEEARERVLAFPGIGPKVADCVLLYGFHKLEAFPVDVWISRVMRRLYFRNRSVPEDKVCRFGMKRWGINAGYVQQYLFHSVRMGVYDILPTSGRKKSHERI